jgi:nitronate monooxygenase
MGTAFLATPESSFPSRHTRDLIVASDGSDTVWTRAYDILDGYPWPEGIGERVRANAFTERWEGRAAELQAQRGDLARPDEDDPDEAPILFGQSAAFVHSIRPAADVIADIVTEAEQFLGKTR